MNNHGLSERQSFTIVLLMFALVILIQGCSDDGGSNMPMNGGLGQGNLNENSETDMAVTSDFLEAPPLDGLRDDELYAIRLREYVVRLDAISRFDEMRVGRSPSCAENVDQSEADTLRFGHSCTTINVDFSRGETLELELNDYVFSSKHRVMGKVVSITTSNQSSWSIEIERSQIDDIFDNVRIRARVLPDPSDESNLDSMQNELRVYQQALMLDSNRSFSFEKAVEHNFNTASNPVRVTAALKADGQVTLDAHLGYSVPDDQEYIQVAFYMVSSISGGFEFESSYDNVRNEEKTLVSFRTPIRLGWFYGDAVFEAKATLDADFNARAGAALEWQSNQTVLSQNYWSGSDGWSGEADAEISPLETQAQFNASGNLSASMGLGFSTSVMVYKLLGPKFTVTPKLSATAKGEVSTISSEGEITNDGQGCLTVKGAIDVELSGVVHGLDDTSLYEQSVVERELLSRGVCEETTLPLDESPPRRDGFQFSVSSTDPSGRCVDYSGGLDADWDDYLRSKAQRCIDSTMCVLSLQTCAARFPNRPKRGTCSVVDYPIEYIYYADVYACPEVQQEGFGPCTLVREQEFDEVTWLSGC